MRWHGERNHVHRVTVRSKRRTELAATYSDLTWLHCTPSSRELYERLGYGHVGDHALLVPVPSHRAH
jgi:hypothetical protein